jgi:prophage regulatory protein
VSRKGGSSHSEERHRPGGTEAQGLGRSAALPQLAFSLQKELMGRREAGRRWTVKFIRPRQVVEMIGVSRSTLWRMVQAGTFPPPVRITERNCGFLLETVESWMKTRAAGLAWEPESEPDGRPILGPGGRSALGMARRTVFQG